MFILQSLLLQIFSHSVKCFFRPIYFYEQIGLGVVDNGYIVNTLLRYGLGPKLVMFFKTLYKNASAKILINGHLSARIGIQRGFKQGDALSNGLFNISNDPLIRNIIADRDIRMLSLTTLRSREEVQVKAGGYADDVFALCGADNDSVKGIFRQYKG